MVIRIKNVCIPSLSEKRRDILIDNGVLKKYNKTYAIDKEIEGDELYLIPSFTDIGTFNGEPGHEERETLETVTRAASRGGYGSLLLLPHTLPTADEGAQIRNLKKLSGLHGVELYPLGSISVESLGNDIAEMLDMAEEGAVGFTDGYHPIQSPGLMIRALDYAKRLKAVIVNQPHDFSVAADGIVHEGEMSMSLGLKGIPAIAEYLMLRRDIELLDYTGSRLHVWNVSTAQGVEIVQEAKEQGLDISCSVSYLHLIRNENSVRNFNATFKISPPLRTEEDRKALIQGVIDGTIDCVTSLHRPWNAEKKDLEFVHAAVGTAGLEIVLPALWTYVPELRDWDLLDKCLNRRAREIFGLKPNVLQWNKVVRGTLVDVGQNFIFDESHIRSKSRNYPFLGKEFIIKINPLKE